MSLQRTSIWRTQCQIDEKSRVDPSVTFVQSEVEMCEAYLGIVNWNSRYVPKEGGLMDFQYSGWR